jgi:putative NADH-flavin reductase
MDPDSVEEAVEGSEAVISALGGEPSNPLHPTRPGDPDGPGSNGLRNIVPAMEAHSIKRLICQTAWGAGDSKENADLPGSFFLRVLLPPLLRDDYADKERAEELLRGSDLDWVIVRPMILTNGHWTGNYRVGENLSPGRRPYISRADVADFLTRQLTGDDFIRKTPAIGY